MIPEGKRSTIKNNRARTIIDAHVKGGKANEMWEVSVRQGSAQNRDKDLDL